MTVSATAGWSDARRWFSLALLLCSVLVVSTDNTVMSFALPAISAEFDSSAVLLLWIVDVYPLVLAGLLVMMGSLADRFGYRRMLLIGAWGFTIASVCAGFATSAQMLVAVRATMGVFGSMLMPATLSLIRVLFVEGRQRSLAVAIWTSCWAIGAALGPILGGFLLAHLWWGSVFLIAVPLFAPLLVFGPFHVPVTRAPGSGPIDVPSVVLSVAAMASSVFALKRVAVGDGWQLSLVFAVFGVISGALFVRRQLQLEHPLLDMSLFRRRRFTVSITANLVALMCTTGLMLFAAQQLQLGLGIDSMTAGWMLVPGAVATATASFVVGRVVSARLRRPVMVAALTLSAMSFTGYALLGSTSGAAVLVLVAAVGAGFGASQAVSNEVVVSEVPAESAGAAAAVSETAYELGTVLGAALLGGITAGVYRAGLMLPAGLSDAEVQRSRETLAGALAVAQERSPEIATQIETAARAALFHAGGVMSLVAAGVVVAVALWAAFGLRSAAAGGSRPVDR
ncbi:MFS transporter [Pseudoclavibacter soli]|uniref:MFS transporter n=1 Tax=Pseudoclavibacter soli TaxID=452623 RepID=UPI00041D9B36|nr:MFS transporter [Pseudoclavibacter soli]